MFTVPYSTLDDIDSPWISRYTLRGYVEWIVYRFHRWYIKDISLRNSRIPYFTDKIYMNAFICYFYKMRYPRTETHTINCECHVEYWATYACRAHEVISVEYVYVQRNDIKYVYNYVNHIIEKTILILHSCNIECTNTGMWCTKNSIFAHAT